MLSAVLMTLLTDPAGFLPNGHFRLNVCPANPFTHDSAKSPDLSKPSVLV